MNMNKSLSDYNPGEGKSKSSQDKLLSTEARDNKDAISGTNELKAYRGKSGKPSGNLGSRGFDF